MMMYTIKWKGDTMGTVSPQALESEAATMAQVLEDYDYTVDPLEIEAALYNMAWTVDDRGRDIKARQASEQFGDDTTDYLFDVEGTMVAAGLPEEDRLDARQAGKLARSILKGWGLGDLKVKAQTVDLSDLARATPVFVYVPDFFDADLPRECLVTLWAVLKGRLNAQGVILSNGY